MSEKKPLVITEFGGPLTRRSDGDINSGLAKFETSWGYDPYSKPGNLTWLEQPTSILTLTGANGPIVAMKQRSEGLNPSDNYVYAIANNETLYKISVTQDSGVDNPNFDSPSVIGTLIDTNWNQGGSMEFYGATEKIFVGSDALVQKINFDGSGVTSIVGTYANSFPRPLKTFIGKLYFGNEDNIGEIDSTELVTTSTKLSPGLPSGMVVRDLDTTPDGNYLQITATRGQSELNPTGSNAPGLSLSESFKFYWNGIDDAATSLEHFPGMRLTANQVIGENNITFGYDHNGMGIMSGPQKIASLPRNLSPFAGATFSLSNTLGFATVEQDKTDGLYRGVVYSYGQYDSDSPAGLYRLLKYTSIVRGNVLTIPVATNVSNLTYARPFAPSQGSIASVAKIYFSTAEGSVVSAANYIQTVMRFPTAPTGLGSVVAGVYETQNQLFSKKIKLGEVRFYTEPLTTSDQSFSLGIVNSASSVVASNNFTVGTNVTAGEDLIRWTPQIAPTYSLGFKITNLGSKNWVGTKLEADINEGGS